MLFLTFYQSTFSQFKAITHARIVKIVFLSVVLTSMGSNALAQCTTDSGVTTVDDLFLEDTGTIDDALDGSCTLAANGDGVLTIVGNVTIDGGVTMAIDASITQILVQGTLTIAAGTTLDYTGIGRFVTIQGNLIINGAFNMTQGHFDNDVDVNGGSVLVGATGSMNVGDDLHVFNDGSFTVAAGGSADVDGSVFNDATAGGGGSGDDGAGTIVINGTLDANDITIFDTDSPANESSISGTGTINVVATFDYQENDPALDFSDCAGGGTCGGTGEELPVELIDFTSSVQSNSVMLEWSTSTEINNDYFIIENSKDGYNWNTVSQIPGNGNSNQLNEYSYQDRQPYLGQSYYRLKQTDYDGGFEYLGPVTVNYLGQNSFSIYPNPASDVLSFQSENLEGTVLTIVSLAGKKIDVPIISIDAGKITYDVSVLNRGLYILRMYNSGKVSSLRFVKL